jgi:hypothetical protein
MGKIPSAAVHHEQNNLQAKLYWQIVARFFLFSFLCEDATSDFFQGQSISPRSISQKIAALRNDSRHSICQVINAIGLNLRINMGIMPQSGKK